MQDSKPLWKHQELAIAQGKDLKAFALLFEPGLGKTRTEIELLRIQYNQAKRIKRTLIIAPTITLENWRNEFQMFTKIDREKLVILYGTGKQREKMAGAMLFGTDPDRIVITNYQTLIMKPMVELLKNWNAEIVVADEMHYVKNPTAVCSKGLRAVSSGADTRHGLTGTAILNTPMDIFGQWLFLDRGATFGDNFVVFRNRFFEDKNRNMPRHIHFPNFIARPNCVDHVKALIQPMAASAIKSECLDLPPLIKKKINVELSPEQNKNYKEMKETFITWLKNGDNKTPVVATTALTKLLRLMQITSGFVKDDDGTEIPYKKNPKAEALDELLETILPNKVIIWAVFKQNYEFVRKVVAKHKVLMVECHGDVPNAKKFEAVERFNTDPNVKVFLGHPRSLGIGINLVAANYMIYYSRDFSLGNDVQSEARNYRAGSEIHDNVTRYDLVAGGTVDELCMVSLENKSEISLSLVKNWVALEG